MTELEHYIRSYFGVTQDDLAQISSYFEPTTLAKGEYFLKAGRYCDKLSFIRSGFLRVFSNLTGREVTQWIGTKGYFVTDLAGLMFEQPSRSSIQALSDCELFTITKADYLDLGRVVPHWHALEKRFLARCFMALEERILHLLSLPAEARYRTLFAQDRELFNHVPLQYLASMMGMTPETLSRLRKKSLDYGE
ncbi:cAMP-binding domain of CRP or a regulatory subunit of cAMP-dependent protein kinases [Catalinimonas alkaloidigena]|uniref:cAMP-binding domain of CRP or a regulatory subunit of cAMP-dependent protein kinases n=1 Tax=Catalinimonas alkaloidigena TaxID=1075417 RepID=A0A1G9UF93_9BACT|nr:Crp/Fnr family transcriptional regulator [Catalinimonas alkaloidigena]SDM58627.1 cAMP-binding domain of CRP or a regulatory subunit of cAMP-dependent protein kinases [Catalinimonas alkaloidigena]